MKKVFFILGVLLSFGMFCACSSDDEVIERSEGSSTRGIDTLESVKMSSVDSFLKEKILNTMNHNHAKGYFSIDEDTCYRIDSMEELAALYQGEEELPEIDFNNNTLLLGAKVFTDPNTDVENYKMLLIESSDGYNFNLYSRHLEGEWTSLGITLQIYYYGLYPKLKDKDISVNLIYE